MIRRHTYAVEEEEKVPFSDISNKIELKCNMSSDIREEESIQLKQKNINIQSIKTSQKNQTKVLFAKKDQIKFNRKNTEVDKENEQSSQQQ